MTNHEVFTNLVNGLHNKDIHALSNLLSEDIMFENIAEGQTTHGKQQVIEKFADFFSKVASIRWNVENQLMADDMIVTILKNNIALQGKNVVLPIVNVLKIRDGKIYSFQDYFDSRTFEQQLK